MSEAKERFINCHDCGVQTDRFIDDQRSTGGDRWSTTYATVYVCADRLDCRARVKAREDAQLYRVTCAICGASIEARRDSLEALQRTHSESHTVAEAIDRLGLRPFYSPGRERV